MGFAYAAVLLSPFATGTAIAHSPRARAFIARCHRSCATVGWTAFVLVPPATVTLEGAPHFAALAILCPLIALTWWRRSDGSDGDDGDGDDPGPLPEPPDVDWERFMRDLDDYRAGLSSSAA